LFHKGDDVEAIILSINHDEKKVSLGIKQLFDDPWPNMFNELPPGKVVEAKVVSLVDYGVFVRVRDGVEGLIAQGDLVQTEDKPLKIGDAVQAEIANIDSQDRRITLSMRIGEGASQAPSKADKRPSMMPKKAAADADKAGGTIGELIKQKLGDKLKEAVAKDDEKDEKKEE
jgi:small subunit ribosomal protein S1